MPQLVSLAVLVGLMYALLILPQQRRVKRHQQLVASLEVGDEVLTSAGIYGRIVGVDPDDPSILRIEVAEGVVLSMDRAAVSEVAVEELDADEPDADEPDADGPDADGPDALDDLDDSGEPGEAGEHP